MDIWYEEAIDALWEPLVDWVHRNSGKKRLFETYRQLPPRARSAFDTKVHAAFLSAHGGSVVMWRRMKPGQSASRMGGMSLTTARPKYTNADAFLVYPLDVFLHPALPDTPLTSKAFGHEMEVILKPDANPKHLGTFSPEQQIPKIAADVKPYSPIQADHRFIRGVLDTLHSGKVVHVRKEYDRICDVFMQADGSWERLFKGNVDDITLMKKIIKIAIKEGHLTKSGGW